MCFFLILNILVFLNEKSLNQVTTEGYLTNITENEFVNVWALLPPHFEIINSFFEELSINGH